MKSSANVKDSDLVVQIKAALDAMKADDAPALRKIPAGGTCQVVTDGRHAVSGGTPGQATGTATVAGTTPPIATPKG